MSPNPVGQVCPLLRKENTMYSKKFVNLLSAGWFLVLLVAVLMWRDEVAGLRSYLARANQRVELVSDEVGTLQTEKFTARMDFEEKLQAERLKTHEANERHGSTLDRVQKGVAAELSPKDLYKFILKD